MGQAGTAAGLDSAHVNIRSNKPALSDLWVKKPLDTFQCLHIKAYVDIIEPTNITKEANKLASYGNALGNVSPLTPLLTASDSQWVYYVYVLFSGVYLSSRVLVVACSPVRRATSYTAAPSITIPSHPQQLAGSLRATQLFRPRKSPEEFRLRLEQV